MTNDQLAAELRRLIELRGSMQSVQGRVNISEEIGDLMEEHSTQIIAALEHPKSDSNGPVEFHVWDGDEFFAQVNGPRDTALAEAMHYASQCVDAPLVEEVTRTPIPYPPPKPGTVDPSLTPEVIRKEAEAGAWNPKPPSAGGASDALVDARDAGRVEGLRAAIVCCFGEPVTCEEERDQQTRDRTRRAIAAAIRRTLPPDESRAGTSETEP